MEEFMQEREDKQGYFAEDTFKEALQAFHSGGLIIVVDNAHRENEGDLVIAAQDCTTEKMAFILRYSSGIICTPLSAQKAAELELPLMVQNNNSLYSTAFTVSVDAIEGTSTGISAYDRNLTVNKLAAADSKAGDFCRPGHIFPLIACEGGVLTRAGHTEAAVDLCSLTHKEPVAVIGELMNDDGTVKKGVQIKQFADAHKLPIISVDSLINFRKNDENLSFF